MEQEMTNTMMPRIGDDAPDFKTVSTKGEIQFSDFAKDKWVVLFSHPADFTPVCTTEMTGFAERKAEFDAMNTELLGLSIDSIHAHLAWVNNVRENTGVYFDFPIIADLDMKVSKLYGMLQPNESETAAVRAVFFIDPKKENPIDNVLPIECWPKYGRDFTRPGSLTNCRSVQSCPAIELEKRR
jgi:peroxiredoxin 2/4